MSKIIHVEEANIPNGWFQKLVAEQKVGGLLLVYLSGKDNNELETKKKLIVDFCKTLK